MLFLVVCDNKHIFEYFFYSIIMIQTLISSKTRIKLLLKFFLNSETVGYLRGLESEFGESSNAIRVELNRLEEAGMLNSFLSGNKKFFKVNQDHPLYGDVRSIVLKYIGLDKIVDEVIKRLGDVKSVYITGAIAKGLDSEIIDIIIFGNVNKNYLIRLIDKVENMISRKVRYVTYGSEEEQKMDWSQFEVKPLMLWKDKE